MPALPAPELLTLQGQAPHTAKVTWYLALAPYGEACFTGQVLDAGVGRGEREIEYYNDAGEGNVLEGMTLWVGSAPGAYDIGKVRIKAIDTLLDILSLAENDDIEWVNDLYLTVPGQDGFRELWGVLPRITEVGGAVTFYEDYDYLYNDPQDDVLPPKANAGPPVCAFLNSDGYVDIPFTGERSYTTEIAPASVDTYLWDFGDGVVQPPHTVDDEGDCDDPIIVRFTTPGFRYVSLTVTDDTAQTRTGIVWVPVWTFDDDHPPLSVQSMVQEGKPHWRLNVTAFASNDVSTDAFYDYPDGALVVLFTSTEYPDGSSDLGGFCYRPTIRFVGWLEEETLSFDYQGGTVSFSAVDHVLMMKKLPGFAYTLEDDDTPSDWYEVKDLDIDRAAHAHLERRSTVNQVCHVERLGDGQNRTIDVQPYPDMSVYDQLQEHLFGDAMATLLCDRQGILRANRDPQMMDAADRLGVATVCTLTGAETLNDIDQSHPHHPQVGLIRLGGFAYATPFLSQAPGDAPTRQDNSIYREGFLVEDQVELNLWSGCMYTKNNNPFPSLSLELKGVWPVFDPAFQEYVNLTASDPLNRNSWTDQPFIVKEVAFRDDAKEGTTITELTLEKVTPVLYGETQAIPTPPTPSPPNPPPGPVNPPNWCGALSKVVLRTTQGVFVTSNFDEMNPDDVFWEASNNNLIAAQQQNILDMAFDYSDGSRAFIIVDTYDFTMAQAVKGAFRCSDVFNQAAWEQMADGTLPYQSVCALGCNDPAHCVVASDMCRTPEGGTNDDQIGCWRAIGCDPISGDVSMMAGVVDPTNGMQSCRRYGLCFYSTDALSSISCGDDFYDPVTGFHPLVWPGELESLSGGQISSSGDVWLYTYSVAWGFNSNRYRALSLNAGALINTVGGIVWLLFYHIWQTRAGQVVYFYTDQGGHDLELAISSDDGSSFTVHLNTLPDTPAASGQALTVHFMDTTNLLLTSDIYDLYYCTDGGFTWALCADQSPDQPWSIAACADTAWPIPDGYGFITGAKQPTDDAKWIFLTRDMGGSWENRTGNLGDFLDHNTDTILQIFPVNEGC